jgi:hypothetical protein
MSSQDTRLANLEGAFERLRMEVQNTRQRTATNEQGLWQTASSMPSPVAGSSGLTRLWLPTGIAAGTFGSPASATDAIAAVPSGNGYTTSGGTTGRTVWNSDATAIAAGKAAWGQARTDGSYDLILGDC